MITNFQS